MRPSQLLAAIVALSSVSAAFPDLFHEANALGQVKNVLLGRQDSSSSSAADASSTEQNKSTDSAQSTDSAKSTDNAKSTDKASASTTSGGTKSTNKASGSNSGSNTSSTPTPTEFGNDVQPGGVNMITPSAAAGSSYYKIGNYVTFAWNYTSLSVSPTAVDVMASCTVNQATYTIALNQSIQATQTIVWNTSDYQVQYPNSQPLLTEDYILMIYDSNSTVSAAGKAGYLAAYTQYSFGMYQPQPYTPWAEFKCAGCSGAMSAMELLTVKVMFITSATTIASFLYFTASFGLW